MTGLDESRSTGVSPVRSAQARRLCYEGERSRLLFLVLARRRGGGERRGRRRTVLLHPLPVGDALLHPGRLRRPLEVMVEELLQAHRVVVLVRPLRQAVPL